MQWNISTKKQKYSGFLSIDEYQISHELYNGGFTPVITRELMERGHAVAVLLFDPNEDRLVLIEQFRIGAKGDDNPWLLELVAGMIDEGESMLEVAIRECREEAGLEITNTQEIMSYYSSPGGCTEQITLFYAEVDSRLAGGIHGLDSEDEDIKVLVIDFNEAMEKLNSGKINSATPIIALQWLQMHHSELVKN